MIIRAITDPEWVEFFPTFTEVVEAAETYAFPLGPSSTMPAVGGSSHRPV